VHDLNLVQSITSSERSLPFIAVCYAHEIVGAAKIELREDGDGAKTVKYIRDKREWITILFGDFVESTVIYSGVKRTVLLHKRTGRPMEERARTDELIVKVHVQELPKCQLFDFGEGAYRTVYMEE